MKGSWRLKAMEERKSHATEWMATARTNESSEWTNGQYYAWTNEQTQQSNERNASQTNGKWTNGTIEQTPANQATQQMAQIHLFLYETKGKTPGQFCLEQRKVFLSGLKKNS